MRASAPVRLAAAAAAALVLAACVTPDDGADTAVAADSAVPLPAPVIPHAADSATVDTARETRHVVYVPVYSRIAFGPAGRTVALAATLSVRNTDPERAIVLHEVRFYDTGGRLLRSYLPRPVPLAPMASTEFVVASGDDAGGAGANFIVQWGAAEPVTEPVVESVMIGSSGGQGISFVSPGRTLARH